MQCVTELLPPISNFNDIAMQHVCRSKYNNGSLQLKNFQLKYCSKFVSYEHMDHSK